LLPESINPRAGWAAHLNGGVSQELVNALNKPHILKKSGIRDIYGNYLSAVSDTPSGKLVRMNITKQEKAQTALEPVNYDIQVNDEDRDADVFNNQISPTSDADILSGLKPFYYDDDEEEKADGVGLADITTVGQDHISMVSAATGACTAIHLLPSYLQFNEYLADDHRNLTIIDCKDFAKTINTRSDRQVHELRLRSAYESYSSGGEPMFTTSQPSSSITGRLMLECMDYIFYSNNFVLDRLLAIPSINEISGNDATEPMVKLDLNWFQAPSGMRQLFNQHQTILSKVMSHCESKMASQTQSTRSSIALSSSKIRRKSIEGRLIAASRTQLISELDSQSHKQYKDELRKSLQRSMAMEPVIPIVPFMPSSTTSPNMPTISNEKTFWAGTWASTFPKKNQFKGSMFLPSQSYCSSHIAICAELVFKANDS
jgi:hypothetical protein